MKASKNQYKNELMCKECGEIITELQSQARKLKLFKTVEKECPKCHKKTDFIVIQDLQTAKQILSFLQYLTPIEEKVIEHINKKENKIK